MCMYAQYVYIVYTIICAFTIPIYYNTYIIYVPKKTRVSNSNNLHKQKVQGQTFALPWKSDQLC